MVDTRADKYRKHIKHILTSSEDGSNTILLSSLIHLSTSKLIWNRMSQSTNGLSICFQMYVKPTSHREMD